MNMEYLSYNLEVKDSELTVAVTATSKQGIRKIDFYEEEGIVQIGVRSVPKSFLFDNTANDSFTASEDIRQVWIGDRIIWANGEMISPLTASLYEVYNPYIGNLDEVLYEYTIDGIPKKLSVTSEQVDFSFASDTEQLLGFTVINYADDDIYGMELWITDQNGKKSKVQGEVNVDIIWGTQYRLNLSGNAESGYFLGH